jgi:RNA polymerase sigma factor (TIGR02999 family)
MRHLTNEFGTPVRPTADSFLPKEMAEGRRGIIGVMTDVTQILCQIESGDPNAAEQLLPLVYEELRKLAAAKLVHEKPGQTLQATGLVHEAYLRLVDVEKARHWNSRGHFFGAAAEAMRRILLNRARDKGRLKRGGQMHRVDLEKVDLAVDAPYEDLLALDESIERLEEENRECANVVKLRFFAGLSIDDAAAALGISASTAKRHWAYARAWLFDALRPDERSASS